MDFSRLFDCMPIQAANPKDDLLAYRFENGYKKITTNEMHKDVYSLASGLIKLGITLKDDSLDEREKIAIISNSRPEWLIADLAIQKSGGIVTPLYPNTNESEIILIFNEVGIRYCFVNDITTYNLLSRLKDQIPTLQFIYTFEKSNEAPHWRDIFVESEELKNEVERISSLIKATDLATIIYTSGTTGRPKGVMLSHENIVSNIKDVKLPIDSLNLTKLRALSFLPLNHILEKMVSYIYLFNGVSIYYAISTNTIAEDLTIAQPEVFVTVPRLLEKVYEKIVEKGHALPGLKKSIFFWALKIGDQYLGNGMQGGLYNFKLKIARKLVFSKWNEALGGNLKGIVSGGAPLQPRLARIFSAAGINILEGYGATETSPVVAVNWASDDNRKFGTVGPVIPSVQIKFDEDGEILVKGPNIMLGYYKMPEETKATFTDDGWFKTGDIGELVDNKFLKITDRKKELLKTSGGKYVAPQPIESKLKESRFIEQVMVIGEGKKFVAALIVPNFEQLKPWMQEQQINFSNNYDACNNPKVQELFQKIIDKYNVFFNHVEQVKKFKLLDKEWTVESGILTPKLSFKRKAVREVYKNEIDEIYGQEEN